jgi:hypothetical protein
MALFVKQGGLFHGTVDIKKKIKKKIMIGIEK